MGSGALVQQVNWLKAISVSRTTGNHPSVTTIDVLKLPGLRPSAGIPHESIQETG